VKAEIYEQYQKKPLREGLVHHTGKGFLPFVILKVDWQVGSPVFFTGLSKAHTFKTGSFGKSSCTASEQAPQQHSSAYRNSDQQRRSFHLLHVCDRACFVCLKGTQDFEGGGNDPDCAIVAPKKEALGA
jgi:hypothetical protein